MVLVVGILFGRPAFFSSVEGGTHSDRRRPDLMLAETNQIADEVLAHGARRR